MSSTLPLSPVTLMVSVTATTGSAGAGAARRLDCARDHACRDEGARGVVDEHDIGLMPGECFEPCEHGGLPRRAAIGRRLVAETCDRCREHGAVVGVHHRLHGKHVGVPAEGFHGAIDHGHAADLAILLGTTGASPQAASGRDEDDCGAL
ncbi:hypothetical protein ACVWXN_003313 [Bradyrhizobium sp. i1.4.4]